MKTSWKKVGAYISVDPGINTGYALWNEYGALVEFGGVSLRDGSWQSRFVKLCRWWEKALQGLEAPRMYIEEPKFMLGALHVAQTGDLVRLVSSFGALCALAVSAGVAVEPVKIAHWKGQLSKENTRRRVLARLDDPSRRAGVSTRELRAANEHEMDAIGLGLYAQGNF